MNLSPKQTRNHPTNLRFNWRLWSRVESGRNVAEEHGSSKGWCFQRQQLQCWFQNLPSLKLATKVHKSPQKKLMLVSQTPIFCQGRAVSFREFRSKIWGMLITPRLKVNLQPLQVGTVPTWIIGIFSDGWRLPTTLLWLVWLRMKHNNSIIQSSNNKRYRLSWDEDLTKAQLDQTNMESSPGGG